MNPWKTLAIAAAVIVSGAEPAQAQQAYSWRYYRPGNTGIQGDNNQAIYVGADGDPWIGGYVPAFEEGGVAQFIQGENRWINISNVGYPVIGHTDQTGCTRVNDIVADAQGNLWLGTWRGALKFDPAQGASSLVRLGPANSKIVYDMTWDIDRAPDGPLWFANQGVVRFDPATDTWTRWDHGNVTIAEQPKPTGGYLIWSSSTPPLHDYTFVFDSDTQQWTTYTLTGAVGEIAGMPGKDCVDETGNLWALRTTSPGGWNSLDDRRPDGTCATPPEPYASFAFYVWAFKAYADRRALAIVQRGPGERRSALRGVATAHGFKAVSRTLLWFAPLHSSDRTRLSRSLPFNDRYLFPFLPFPQGECS